MLIEMLWDFDDSHRIFPGRWDWLLLLANPRTTPWEPAKYEKLTFISLIWSPAYHLNLRNMLYFGICGCNLNRTRTLLTSFFPLRDVENPLSNLLKGSTCCQQARHYCPRSSEVRRRGATTCSFFFRLFRLHFSILLPSSRRSRAQ